MDEEEAAKNVIRKAKKIKAKSKKGEKNEKGSMGLDEGQNINELDAIEHVRVSGKVEIAEMKRDCKKNKAIEVSEADIVNGTGEGDLTVSYSEEDSGDAMDTVKRKKKKTSSAKEVEGNGNRKTLDEESISEVKLTEDANEEGKKQKVKRKCQDGNFDKEGEKDGKKKKMKKKNTQLMENGSDDLPGNEVEYEKKGKMKKTKSMEIDSNGATPVNKSNKKVRFSDQDEVFLIPGDSNMETGEGNLVRGKRFTHEEDGIVKEAVFDYIERHDLGEEGLKMVLNCQKHNLKGCWKEIASALPHRPLNAVYHRAQILFSRSEDRKWTQEEHDTIIKYQQEHGNQWKELAEKLGRSRVHVKLTYQSIKLRHRNKGRWSQDEYQKLFDLVNIDLQSKVSQPKRSKHGMLRDNVRWTAISDELSTRRQADCCLKWYSQLTSRMVTQGEWADTDDYRLIGGLYSLDATCVEDVDWDGLLEDRTGDVCQKRWNQMVLHIGKHGHKSFGEQVEVLAQRYCPHLLEAREAWDSKPRVP
ncbi:hypothetical protein CASFOL_021753 [Castilleja foliolosa]|uniref:Uncharacterized protein n=1 Tax=Castilleja foliolosa TaxID=1961234 RepID=A0ABD3D058_9LAMI